MNFKTCPPRLTGTYWFPNDVLLVFYGLTQFPNKLIWLHWLSEEVYFDVQGLTESLKVFTHNGSYCKFDCFIGWFSIGWWGRKDIECWLDGTHPSLCWQVFLPCRRVEVERRSRTGGGRKRHRRRCRIALPPAVERRRWPDVATVICVLSLFPSPPLCSLPYFSCLFSIVCTHLCISPSRTGLLSIHVT